METFFILPGLGNSGPDHWQSVWERSHPSFVRVEQDEWDSPKCEEWVARLEEYITRLDGCCLLISHSSSCALVAHWALSASPENLAKVHGALLVAPSDPHGPCYPLGPTGFGPVPLRTLPFPTIVVASTNDQYVTLDCARAYAHAWGSRMVELENAGHINVASGFGPWPEGMDLLKEL